jgi:ABC-type transporter Mla MlaB component
MLKISQVGTANHSVKLKLEGRVIGPWVDELRQICEPLLSEGRALNLDLADVSYVDADGVAALTGLKSRGVTVTNCSPFVEEQLKGADAKLVGTPRCGVRSAQRADPTSSAF